MTLKSILLTLIVFCAVTTFGYWRYKASHDARPIAQIAIMRDASDSIPSDCDQVVGLTERALSMPDVGPGTSITLMRSGDDTTANEPQLLGKFQVPEIRRVIEGQRLAARQRAELITNLKTRCEEIKHTQASPIFQSVQRGVEYLRSTGSSTAPRYLFLQTDGEETVNLQIKKALDQKLATKSKLPRPVSNNGIQIVFCGLAETVGTATSTGNKVRRMTKQRDPERNARMQEVWLTLFTNPELVTFEPYCLKEGALNKSNSIASIP